MKLRVFHKYRIMLQRLRQSSCFMETIFQEVQKNTAERLSYAGSEFNSFHKFDRKSPPVCWNFTTVKFRETQSQLSYLMHGGRAPMEWQPSKVWEVAPNLSVTSQPAGQSNPWSVQRMTANHQLLADSTLCFLLPSLLAPQLGLRSNGGYIIVPTLLCA